MGHGIQRGKGHLIRMALDAQQAHRPAIWARRRGRPEQRPANLLWSACNRGRTTQWGHGSGRMKEEEHSLAESSDGPALLPPPYCCMMRCVSGHKKVWPSRMRNLGTGSSPRQEIVDLRGGLVVPLRTSASKVCHTHKPSQNVCGLSSA